MSEEENKAIEYIKNKIKNKLPKYEEKEIDGEIFKTEIIQLDLKFNDITADKCDILLNLIEKQQKQLELKDKVIDEMAKAINNYDVSFHINHFKNIEHIKEVFTNKIKEDKE